MTNIYFIPVAYLQSILNINENTSDIIVRREILNAQELDLMPILGESLYDKLATEIENDTVSGNYKTLLDRYVVKYIAFAAYVRLLMTTSYKMANGNLFRSQSINGNEMQVSYMRSLQTQFEGDRNTYGLRLERYLCNNSGDFPEYRNNQADQVKSRNNTLFGGISLTNLGEVPSYKK